MRFVEISGADSVGVAQCTSEAVAATGISSIDRVDAVTDKGAGALRAAQTLSMFEPARVVVVSTPEKVSVAIARELAKLAHDGAVIFSGAKPVSAAVRKALPGLESHKFPLPSTKNSTRWVQERFQEQGVQLPRESVSHLSQVAVEPLGASRIRQLVDVLHASGQVDPSPELIAAFTADLGVPEAAWAASDSVTRGDLAGARAGGDVEPIVALSILARRLSRIGAVLEQSAPPAELASMFGMNERAVHMLARGVTASVADVTQAYDLVIDAAARCRQVSDPTVSRAICDDASLKAAEIFRS